MNGEPPTVSAILDKEIDPMPMDERDFMDSLGTTDINFIIWWNGKGVFGTTIKFNSPVGLLILIRCVIVGWMMQLEDVTKVRDAVVEYIAIDKSNKLNVYIR